ncbi:MAG: hypothetical protein HXY18_01225 [Bryobacteraceae bacterium]|nr:hypothetical protein [Bryobacteraceae bacterium]
MKSPIFHPARPRQILALSMALIVAFLGIAVFSSLHKHQGPKNRCSLNGFDQLMTGEAEAAQTVQAAMALEWREPCPAGSSAPLPAPESLFLRGPPSAA